MARLQSGMRPTMARPTLAALTITLAMWKSFDPKQLQRSRKQLEHLW
jgi:hypothetical protein